MARASANGYAGVIKKLQNAPVDPADPNAVKAPVGYGVFSQGLSSALASHASDPFYGGADVAALQGYTDQERATVAASTAADREAQFYASILPSIINKVDDKGTVSEFDTASMGPYGKIFNPVTIAADASIRRANDIATGHKTNADAAKTLTDAGVNLDPTDVNAGQGNPVFGTPADYGVIPGRANAGDQAAMITANASMKKADADLIDANNPRKYAKTGGAGGGTTTSIVVPIPGVGMATIKGKDPASIMTQARGYTTSPQLQAKKAAAARHGYTVADSGDGGIVVSNGKGQSLRYDAQGNMVR